VKDLSSHEPVYFSYGMRYMAKVLKAALEQKFPETEEKDVLKVCYYKRMTVNFVNRSLHLLV